jgi:hypothetical protein
MITCLKDEKTGKIMILSDWQSYLSGDNGMSVDEVNAIAGRLVEIQVEPNRVDEGGWPYYKQ